ncbi:PEP-utilizing enzyme [Thermoproteota archaeon]
MNPKELNPKNYKCLFRMHGDMTCAHSELFVKGSLGLGNAIVLFKDGVWHSFIDKEKEKLCLEKGLRIFSSKKSYRKYSETFRNFISHTKKDLIPRFSKVPKNITRKEFVDLINDLMKFWYLYGITEFSYHDFAYKVSQKTKDPILKKNLDDLGRLKFEGRKILNAIVFENGIQDNALKYISHKYLDGKGAKYLYPKELIGLFDGVIPDREIIEQRKKCFGIANIDSELIKFNDHDTLDLINRFTELDKSEDIEYIKGIIASKGIARGRVVIALMLNDPEKINKVIAKMNKGDILVAQSTTPELIELCHKASAIVTDQGGMLSHAAIVGRELGIPCVIGTEIATQLLKDGDFIEVNADTGIVRIIDR